MNRLIHTGCWFLAVVFLCSSSALAQNERGFDTNYITGDSFFVFAVSPSRLIAHLPEDSPIVKEGFAPFAAGGLQLSDVDSYSFQVAPTDDFDALEESVLMVMQVNKALDIERFAESLGTDGQRVEYQGRPRYKSPWEGGPEAFFPSDHTALMGMPERVDAAAASPMSMSPIVSKLRAVSPTAEAVVMVDFSLGSRDMFAMLMDGSMLPVPDQIVELMQAVKSITAVVDLRKDQPINIAVVTETEEAAKRVEAFVKQAMPVGLEAAKQAGKNETPREEFRPAFERLMEAVLIAIECATVETKGNEVRVVVQREGGLKNLAEVLNLMVFEVHEVSPEPVQGIEIR